MPQQAQLNLNMITYEGYYLPYECIGSIRLRGLTTLSTINSNWEDQRPTSYLSTRQSQSFYIKGACCQPTSGTCLVGHLNKITMVDSNSDKEFQEQ